MKIFWDWLIACLAAIFIALMFGWIALVVVQIVLINDKPTTQTEHAEPTTSLVESFEICRYGGNMFYVGRNFTPEEALELAITDCRVAYQGMGEEQFRTFYGPLDEYADEDKLRELLNG